MASYISEPENEEKVLYENWGSGSGTGSLVSGAAVGISGLKGRSFLNAPCSKIFKVIEVVAAIPSAALSGVWLQKGVVVGCWG